MKKVIISIILLLAIGVIVWFVLPEKDKIQFGEISEDLELKVPKDRILYNEEIDWIDCDENMNCVNKGKIVTYDYISVKEVPISTHEGLTEDLSKRIVNAQFFKKENEWVGKFYTGSPFYREDDKWFQVETATTSIDAWDSQTETAYFLIPPVFGATASYYSGAGDGRVYQQYNTGGSETWWDGAHDAASGTEASHTETNYIPAYTRITAAANCSIYRGFFPFDTSGLPDAAVISAATFYFYVYQAPADGGDEFALVQTFQASNTVLENDDYEDCGSDDGNPARAKYTPVEGATRLDITNIPNNDPDTNWQSMPLNETGIGWISTTGYTKLGTRIGADCDNQETADTIVNDTRVRFSEYADTASDPYFEITYEEAAERRIIITQ